MAAVALLAPAAPQLPGLVEQKSEKLWSEALSSLKPDLRESLLSVEGDRRATLEVVLFEARNKREIAMRKQWKITKKNGDIIILRDVFEKIIQWVDRFKAIGDTAMSAAPSYASIPWNVVCVLIKVAINESEEFAAMIDGLQEVTNVIARYAIFESIYLQQHTSATEHLEASLVSLYAAVLSFLGEADAHFGRNTARRFLRSTVRPASEIEKSLELIRSRQIEVDRTANIVGMEILQNTSTAMYELVTMVGNLTLQLNITNYRLEQMHTSSFSRPKSPIESLKSVVTSIMSPTRRLSQRGPMAHDDLSPEKRRIIFDWLSPVKYQTHHLVETKDRLPNSGAWMFRSSQFRNWKDSSISETLWLHGMPGCGKTKLASAVIDLDLGVDTADTSNAAPVAYFYCSRNSAEPERWDPSEVLRCIARQLCRDDPDSSVYEPLKHLYEKADKSSHGERRIDNDACVDLVLQLLRENPATIVIDALDELDPDRRHSLLESLDQIVKRSANVIKVFMTSRDDLDISIRLRSTPNLYISASSNQIDVASFIDVKLHEAVEQKKLLGGIVPPGLILKMKATLNDGAGGRFRWVSLQISNLCDPKRMGTQEDILRELEHLPESLQDLYSIALQQINQLQAAYMHTARTALQLLLVAVRPIPWSEFLHLLSVNPNSGDLVVLKTDVISMTGNFLLDDDHSDTPRFAHQSAREYLESLPDFESLSSNASAAHICLHHIKQPGTWDSRNFSYSSFYLGNHLGKTHERQRGTFRPILEEILLPMENNPAEAKIPDILMVESELFQKWRRRISSFKATGYLGNDRNMDGAELCPATMVSTKPIFAICSMGLAEFLPMLPRGWLQTDEQPSLDFSDLSAVGYEALRHYHMRNTLEIAILFGQSGVVATFQQLGLDIDRVGAFSEKPIHLAAKLGNNDILRLLLSFGVDPNAKMSLGVARPEEDSQNKTSLHDANDERRRPASSLGFHVRINNRSEVRSPFFSKQESLSTLHLAMHTPNAAQCVQTLIEYGASVNLRTSSDVTPLQRCLEYGNSKVTAEVFKILLAAGSRPNDALPGGQSIVHVVATMGRSDIIRLLLEAGADCVTEDHHGQTPYDLAQRMGNPEVIALLAAADAEYRRTHPHKSHELFKHHSTSDIPLFNVELDDSSTTIASDAQPSDGEYLSPNAQSKRPKFLTKLVNREWGRLTSGR